MLESLFNKVAGLQGNYIKKRIQHRCFPVNNAKILGTPDLKSICVMLLLVFCKIRNLRLKFSSYTESDLKITHQLDAVYVFTIPQEKIEATVHKPSIKKAIVKKLSKTNQGKEALLLEFLSGKVADFSYSLQNLLKRKLNAGVFRHGSFLRTPLANALVKRFLFGVRLNAGKNICHPKS